MLEEMIPPKVLDGSEFHLAYQCVSSPKYNSGWCLVHGKDQRRLAEVSALLPLNNVFSLSYWLIQRTSGAH